MHYSQLSFTNDGPFCIRRKSPDILNFFKFAKIDLNNDHSRPGFYWSHPSLSSYTVMWSPFIRVTRWGLLWFENLSFYSRHSTSGLVCCDYEPTTSGVVYFDDELPTSGLPQYIS